MLGNIFPIKNEGFLGWLVKDVAKTTMNELFSFPLDITDRGILPSDEGCVYIET